MSINTTDKHRGFYAMIANYCSKKNAFLAATLVAAELMFPGIAHAYPAVGSTGNPAGLLTAIRNAYNSGSTGVTINPGKYIIPINTGGVAWDLSGMSNFTIDAPGVTLFFADSAYDLIRLDGNNNFTIQGATFSSPPNFTQGRVYNEIGRAHV